MRTVLALASLRRRSLTRVVTRFGKMPADAYKQAVLAGMLEALRPASFQKRGSCFERRLQDVVHLVGLQASTGTTPALLRVTVNIAVWVPSLAESNDRPDLWSAHWRMRIGQLMPEHSDIWWNIATDHEASVAATGIRTALVSYALPALDRLPSLTALQQLWQSGKAPGLTKIQVQRYLENIREKQKIG